MMLKETYRKDKSSFAIGLTSPQFVQVVAA